MLDAPVSFRTKKDNKEYLMEIGQDNGIGLSDLLNHMIEHYIQSGDVIRFTTEIKRKNGKNNDNK